MNTTLRFVVLTVVAALCAGSLGLVSVHTGEPAAGGKKMYGLIGKASAVEGKRDELIAILLPDKNGLPGCLSYIVAKDPADANAIWITEVWEDEASHKASLSLPAVRAAIAKGRPLIAKFDQRVVTEPVGGYGLAPAKQP
jgi:quinol monooxygenase YgiN